MTTITTPPRVNPRFQPIDILRENIKSCLWAEDALAFYQVPTVVFELYLLVPDEDHQRASSCILFFSPDYGPVPLSREQISLLSFREVFLKYSWHRFMGPWSKTTKLQLLPAREYAHFTISGETTVVYGIRVYPKLSCFIEALVEQHLETASSRRELHRLFRVMMYLAHLGDYSVERNSVLQNLDPKARRLWKDILERTFILGEED